MPATPAPMSNTRRRVNILTRRQPRFEGRVYCTIDKVRSGAGRVGHALDLAVGVFIAVFLGNGEGGNDLAGECRADALVDEIGVVIPLSGETERELTGEGIVETGISLGSQQQFR